MSKIKLTLEDLDEVINEIRDITGTLDKYDIQELREIIADFGVSQFNRGFERGIKKENEGK